MLENGFTEETLLHAFIMGEAITHAFAEVEEQEVDQEEDPCLSGEATSLPFVCCHLLTQVGSELSW